MKLRTVLMAEHREIRKLLTGALVSMTRDEST